MNKTSKTDGDGGPEGDDGPEPADASGTRFVGRGAELRRVVGALTRPPAVVLVEGEAGIGKSRLVREALAAVEAEYARPLVALCPPFRTALTWGGAAAAWSRLPRPEDEARARAGVERCTRAAWKARQGGRPGYGNQLSPRESDVVALVLQGMTNREIAAVLSRSPNTVAAQLKSAMRKFGVTSRTALAVSVTQGGFLLDSRDGAGPA